MLATISPTWVNSNSPTIAPLAGSTTARRNASLWIGVGLFVGDGLEQPLIAGYPDLFLAIDADPRRAFGRAISQDQALIDAAHRWATEAPPDRRLDRVTDGSWQPLATRTSARHLLDAGDQGQAVDTWLRSALQAWLRHGLVEHLVRLAP